MRKSSKIRDISDEFAKRLPRIEQKEDFVNYNYFLTKLFQFEIGSRIDTQERNTFTQRAMQSTLANIDSMCLDDIIRHFADSSQMEQALGLANKLTEIIKGQTKASPNTGGTPPKHEI